ncbi:glycosyltransferase family 4 protein [Massilia sp. R2A-15]|uniref:glycosyltransferase family 4 protein n=1 Tax=Massilia sp. R2A-15 TaxID=3064278 RepID=UPI0027327EE3|nr:glycosyltransferase family 4 protein [Massilia sp. R2A-15]WLI88039.1 glycosyltransferase family 4 protein [Massilia sp. R2A-15]
MRIALVADVFPPLRSSGAVQLRDLARELVRQGHEVTAMIASPDLQKDWQLESIDGVQVLRLRTPKTKDVGYLRRTIGELLMPFAMLRNLRRSPLAGQRFDGVTWYSPSIFLGPLVKMLKTTSACPSYLIIRDIFPEWAVDMGLMGRGLPYRFFKAVANYQYSVADIIGVQSPGNLDYFANVGDRSVQRLEVLHNWLAEGADAGCSINVSDTALKGRKIFVYAGNMGVAQGVDVLLELAERLQERADIGFLFVGRGSDVARLRGVAVQRELDNVVFADEIDPDEIPGLYAQCHVGLVALDPRHKSHNIPGKFLSYMQSALPVLACINPGNDLIGLINGERIGSAYTGGDPAHFAALAEQLVEQIEKEPEIQIRCTRLAAKMFSAEAAVSKIVCALGQKNEHHSIFAGATERPYQPGAEVAKDKAAPQYPSRLS